MKSYLFWYLNLVLIILFSCVENTAESLVDAGIPGPTRFSVSEPWEDPDPVTPHPIGDANRRTHVRIHWPNRAYRSRIPSLFESSKITVDYFLWGHYVKDTPNEEGDHTLDYFRIYLGQSVMNFYSFGFGQTVTFEEGEHAQDGVVEIPEQTTSVQLLMSEEILIPQQPPRPFLKWLSPRKGVADREILKQYELSQCQVQIDFRDPTHPYNAFAPYPSFEAYSDLSYGCDTSNTDWQVDVLGESDTARPDGNYYLISSFAGGINVGGGRDSSQHFHWNNPEVTLGNQPSYDPVFNYEGSEAWGRIFSLPHATRFGVKIRASLDGSVWDEDVTTVSVEPHLVKKCAVEEEKTPRLVFTFRDKKLVSIKTSCP